MSGTSLPTVSAKIDGDASGIVSAFKKAETASSTGSAKIAADVDHLSKRIATRFSLGHLGTEVMRGIGIGSGFQVAETAAAKIVDYYREAASLAKDIADSSDRQLANTKRLIELQRTDKQNMDQMIKDQAELAKTIADISAKLKTGGTTRTARDSTTHTDFQKFVPYSQEERDQMKRDREKAKEDLGALSIRIKEAANKAEEAGARVIDSWYEKMKSLGDKLTDELKTPWEKFQDRIGELADTFYLGDISAETFMRGIAKAQGELRKDELGKGEKPKDPLTDRFTRIGLLSGAMISGTGTNDIPKRQLETLNQIRDSLRRNGWTGPLL